MSKRQSLAVVGRQAGDPLRSALAAAIDKADRTRRALLAHDTAIAKAKQLIVTLEEKLASANAVMAAARDQAAGAIAQAITDDAPVPATSAAVKAAIDAEGAAVNEVEAARAGLDRLRSDRRDREVAVAFSDLAILAEVQKVVSPMIEQLIARAWSAHRELTRCAAVLCAVRAPEPDGRTIPAGLDFAERYRAAAMRRFPGELYQAIDSVLAAQGVAMLRYNQDDETLRLVREWRAAVAQLRRDAAAALPVT
jgi:hypothetical protein